jgi:hypothetical protein
MLIHSCYNQVNFRPRGSLGGSLDPQAVRRRVTSEDYSLSLNETFSSSTTSEASSSPVTHRGGQCPSFAEILAMLHMVVTPQHPQFCADGQSTCAGLTSNTVTLRRSSFNQLETLLGTERFERFLIAQPSCQITVLPTHVRQALSSQSQNASSRNHLFASPFPGFTTPSRATTNKTVGSEENIGVVFLLRDFMEALGTVTGSQG